MAASPEDTSIRIPAASCISTTPRSTTSPCTPALTTFTVSSTFSGSNPNAGNGPGFATAGNLLIKDGQDLSLHALTVNTLANFVVAGHPGTGVITVGERVICYQAL